MLACPTCHHHLNRVRTPSGQVWDCPRRHGRFALLGVLRGGVQRSFLDRIWKEAFWGSPRPGGPCPGCGKTLAQVRSDGTDVEVCRRCQGLWISDAARVRLPAPELREQVQSSPAGREALALAQVSAMQTRYQQGEAIGGAPQDDWKRILGVLGLPVEIGAMETTRRPWATWTLCLLIVAVGVFSIGGDLNQVIASFGFLPDEPMRHGGVTWITAFFLHAGVAHLLGNLWFLWMLGDNVEDRFGWRRFLILVLAATFAGAALHLIGDPRGSIPCVGASGGISGIITAYALAFPRAQIGIAFWWGAFWLRLPAWVWVGLWVLGQTMLAGSQVQGAGYVSALAHLGGAAAGLVLAWVWLSPKPGPSPS